MREFACPLQERQGILDVVEDTYRNHIAKLPFKGVCQEIGPDEPALVAHTCPLGVDCRELQHMLSEI